MVIAHCTGWWTAWAGAIYMEITGQEEEGRLVAPNQPRGHHRRLSLLHSSSIFVCLFAFLLCLLFFLSFTSQPFFMTYRREIWGGQEIMASGWWLCESNARVHGSFLLWNSFLFLCLLLRFGQDNDDNRDYDNQGGIEGTVHTRYMGPPLTPAPSWSASYAILLLCLLLPCQYYCNYFYYLCLNLLIRVS